MKCSKCGLDVEKVLKVLDNQEKLASNRIRKLEKLLDEKIELLKSI
jgi:hypothetical protein